MSENTTPPAVSDAMREAVAPVTRAEVRACIGPTIPLRRRWVDLLMQGPIARLHAEIARLTGERDAARVEAERSKRHGIERHQAWDRTNSELFDANKARRAAEAEARGRRQLREELSAKAEEQVAYWRKRQSAEKALEEGLSEDGETCTPIGDQPAWQSGYCNGRMSEADWWRQTLFYLSPDDKLPAPSEAATANAALAAFVSAFEGIATPLSEKQERAYEEAAQYLDGIGARPPCPCPACRDARARATAPAETQKPEDSNAS
jgi:hypothetical protein